MIRCHLLEYKPFISIFFFFFCCVSPPQAVSGLHWEERSSLGEPHPLFAIQTPAGGAEKNHFLGCRDPQAGEESWDWETKPAPLHMRQGRELLGHLRVLCSGALLLFLCSSVFSLLSEWSLTTNPFDGNLWFPALWKTDPTSFLDNCSPLLSWVWAPHSPHNLCVLLEGDMIHFSWIKYGWSLKILLGLIPLSLPKKHTNSARCLGDVHTLSVLKVTNLPPPDVDSTRLWPQSNRGAPHLTLQIGKIHQGIVKLERKKLQRAPITYRKTSVHHLVLLFHQEVLLEISCILYFGCAKFIFHSC